MKFPLWASVFTVIGVMVLTGLGGWQMHRLQWKTALLAQIEQAYAADPMDFELTGEAVAGLHDHVLIKRGFAEGMFRHEDESLLSPRTHEGRPGYHVITPFETIDNNILMVNRGWIPLSYEALDIERPDGPVIITGTLRRPEIPNMFVPENNPAAGQWHRLDLQEIAKVKGLGAVLPFILYVENDAGFPLAIATKWQPNNNHLAYAIFWHLMAVILTVIYYLRFVRSRQKEGK